jgi:hypothetical protein
VASLNIRGGDKTQQYLNDIAKKLDKNETLRVGFLSRSTYPDGTKVAMVAAIQNFGAPAAGIPARPFFTNMVTDKSPNWGKSLGNILVNNEYDVDKSLESMGAGIKGQLQTAIKTFSDVALADSTIEAKGFAKQLVDTGHMLNSVDYEVKE